MSSNFFKSVALFLGLAISLGVLVMGFLSLRSYFTKASGSAEPKSIRSANITATAAQIAWDSQLENQGLVRYSSDPKAFETGNSGNLLFAAESAPSTKHEVKLNSLKPGTTYYYEVSIGSSIYDQNGLVKDNKHLPYTLTTTSSTQTGTGVDNAVNPNLDPVIFKQKFGSSDPLYDLNKDGVVNGTDYLLYLSRTATP